MLSTHLFISCGQLGLSDLWKIKKYFGDFDKALLAKNKNDLLASGISPDKCEYLRRHIVNFDAEIDLLNLETEGIKKIDYDDELYPDVLRNIYLPPLALYVRGNEKILSEKNNLFAVVGPRRPSKYGESVANIFCSCLAQNGIVIVSGLAQGIDAIAHRQALKNNVPTIAVLGSDIRNIYPRFHTDLAANIINKGGLIISESPPCKIIRKFNFAIRNRIISGLSLGVLIAEAGKKSGSLITARLGFEQNRTIYAVPNAIFEENSIGTNRLIASNMAKPVFSPYAILEDLKIDYKRNVVQKKSVNNIDKHEKYILKSLTYNPTHLQNIQQLTGLSVKQLLIILSNLEIKGLIENVGQMSYAKIRH